MRFSSSILVAGAALAAVCLGAPQASAQNVYGAIFFAPQSGAYGYSKNNASQQEAENDAMRECQNQGGSDCTRAVWFRNGCGALAVGTGNGWGGDWGNNQNEAQSKAVNRCSQYTQQCRVVETICAPSND